MAAETQSLAQGLVHLPTVLPPPVRMMRRSSSDSSLLNPPSVPTIEEVVGLLAKATIKGSHPGPHLQSVFTDKAAHIPPEYIWVNRVREILKPYSEVQLTSSGVQKLADELAPLFEEWLELVKQKPCGCAHVYTMLNTTLVQMQTAVRSTFSVILPPKLISVAMAMGSPLHREADLEPGSFGMQSVYHHRDCSYVTKRPKSASEIAALAKERDIDLTEQKVKDNAQESLEQWVREQALLLSILPHPNIIAYYGTTEIAGAARLIFEYAALGDLFSVLENRKLPSFSHARDVAQGLALGLAYLHRRNIVHRDLKPENLVLNEHYCVKIIDFGLARRLDPADPDSMLGGCVGTPEYIPPEVVPLISSGRQIPISMKGDVWAYGCVVYDLLGDPQGFLHRLAAKYQKRGESRKIGRLFASATQMRVDGVLNASSSYTQDHYGDTVFQNEEGKRLYTTMLAIAKQCLALNPENRLDSAEVIVSQYFTQVDPQ